MHWGYISIGEALIAKNQSPVKHFEKKAKAKGATKILSEEIYDWNVGFFLKAGYKVAGELKDLPKGHSFYIVEKDL